MDQRWKYNFIIHILLSIMTVLAAAALFLFYENRLAEDMIRELNRDYEELLRERGRQEKPVLLKRSFGATVTELLQAAEYILAGGNERVILCERGIRTFEKYTRNTLDLSAVPIIHEKTHLPIIVDPSHATGKANLVEPMMIAAVAAGADGLEVEVHYDPRHAWSDGAQCLTPDAFAQAMAKCRQVAWAIGRDM